MKCNIKENFYITAFSNRSPIHIAPYVDHIVIHSVIFHYFNFFSENFVLNLQFHLFHSLFYGKENVIMCSEYFNIIYES